MSNEEINILNVDQHVKIKYQVDIEQNKHIGLLMVSSSLKKNEIYIVSEIVDDYDNFIFQIENNK